VKSSYLDHSRLHKTFILESDASGNGIGVVLMQEGRPLDFESRPLKGKDLQKPIYEKEIMTILHELRKWHPYLIGRHFKVKIYHDTLKYFLEQRLSSEEQQKWVTKILGYDFEIVYKKGKKIFVVDADAGASLQPSYVPASQHTKCKFNGRRECQPSHFSNFEKLY
jgi:hypothetical protein